MSIRELQQKVSPLCKELGVKSLHLFGSRARNADLAGRDYDFVVDFPNLEPKEYADKYFKLLHGLEDTLLERIDLLTRESLTKDSLIKNIEKDSVSLYE